MNAQVFLLLFPRSFYFFHNRSCHFWVQVLEATSEIGGRNYKWNAGTIGSYTNVTLSVGGSFWNPNIEPRLSNLMNTLGLTALIYPPLSYNISSGPEPIMIPPILFSSNPNDYLAIATARKIGYYASNPWSSSIFIALDCISVQQWIDSQNFTANQALMLEQFVYSLFVLPAASLPALPTFRQV